MRRFAIQSPSKMFSTILLVVDEDAPHYLSFRNPIATPLLSGQLAELPFVAPFDTVLLSDLDRIDTSEYRLVLIVNALKLDVTQRHIVQRRLKTGGKTLVWLYAPGLFRSSNGPAEVAGIQDVTGIRAAPEPPRRWPPSSRHRRSRQPCQR
jgi:hypothetical protein